MPQNGHWIFKILFNPSQNTALLAADSAK